MESTTCTLVLILVEFLKFVVGQCFFLLSWDSWRRHQGKNRNGEKKTWLWKLPFCVQQSVSLTSWTRPPCVSRACMMQWANVFLLFIGKEGTNRPVPWKAQIWRRKVLLLHKYLYKNHAKLENVMSFLWYCQRYQTLIPPLTHHFRESKPVFEPMTSQLRAQSCHVQL